MTTCWKWIEKGARFCARGQKDLPARALRGERARQLQTAVMEALEPRLFLSGTMFTYNMPEAFGGKFYDAEKASNAYPFNFGEMCWAATAANMLAWTRWGLVGDMGS